MIKSSSPCYMKFRPSKINIGQSFLDDIHKIGLNEKFKYKSFPKSPLDYFNRSLLRVPNATSAFNLIPKWLKATGESFHMSNDRCSREGGIYSNESRSKPFSSVWVRYNFNDVGTLRNLREKEERYRREEERRGEEKRGMEGRGEQRKGEEGKVELNNKEIKVESTKVEPEEETIIDLISLKKKKRVKGEVQLESSHIDATSTEGVKGNISSDNAELDNNWKETPSSSTTSHINSSPSFESNSAGSELNTKGSRSASNRRSNSGIGSGSSNSTYGSGSGSDDSGDYDIKYEPPIIVTKKQKKSKNRVSASEAARFLNKDSLIVEENIKIENETPNANEVESRKPIKVPTKSVDELELVEEAKDKDGIRNENENDTEAMFAEYVASATPPLHESIEDVSSSTSSATDIKNQAPVDTEKLENDTFSPLSTQPLENDPMTSTSTNTQTPSPVDTEKLENDTFSPLSTPPPVNDSITTGEDLLESLKLKNKYKDPSKDFERLLSLVDIENKYEDKKPYVRTIKRDTERKIIDDSIDNILPQDIRSSYVDEVLKEKEIVKQRDNVTTETVSPLASISTTIDDIQPPSPTTTPPPTTPPPPPLTINDVHNLQSALKESKADTDKHLEEMFRIENAVEYTKSISSKRPRSIESGNFFTPVHRPFVKNVKSDQTFEYIIVTPNQKFIRTKTLPFKDDHPRRDLFSALSEMPDPAKYVKTIAKLEKANWKCIGGGGPGRLLVFEREYNSTNRFTKLLLKITGGFIGFVGLASIAAVMIESPFKG